MNLALSFADKKESPEFDLCGWILSSVGLPCNEGKWNVWIRKRRSADREIWFAFNIADDDFWTVGWVLRCVTQYMIGVRPTYEGLLIDSVLPDAWPEVKMVRKFRQARYDITIRKSSSADGAFASCFTLVDKTYRHSCSGKAFARNLKKTLRRQTFENDRLGRQRDRRR